MVIGVLKLAPEMERMNADIAALRELEQTILSLVRLMVDDSDAVRIEVLNKPTEILLRLHVDPSDAGLLIGRQGRTARSLRIILGSIAVKFHHSISLDIVANREAQD
jgi:predicted RNA-binding protein YlqC (UPF0109 family)